MAILYYGKQPFPHVSLTINDNSLATLAGGATGNVGRMGMGIFANYGPDDRTLYIRSEAEFYELFGKQTINKHSLMGKACIKALRRGGHIIVRRLTDSASKNANASLDVTVSTPAEARTIYLNLKTSEWSQVQPTGTVDVDYIAVETTAPTFAYGYRNHTGLKTVDHAEMVAPETTDGVVKIPAYVLMRTGSGSAGNKTKVAFSKTKVLSNNKDNTYAMNVILTEDSTEKYRINGVIDSRYETTPLNIREVLNRQSYQLNVHSSESNLELISSSVIEGLDVAIADLELAAAGFPLRPAITDILTTEIATLVAIKESIENDDIQATAVTSFFGASDRFPSFSAIFETGDYISEVKLAGGTNGELLKGKFDWNYTITEGGEEVKIYEKLMKEFFEGAIDPEILDFNISPIDFIPDVAFPVAVKETLSTFCKEGKRRDVICTIAPSKCASVTELKSFDEGFKINNYNAFKVPNWVDVYDTDELKTIQVPATYCLIDTIYDFINDGWSDPPLSGRVVPGPVEGTVIPKIDILNDIEDKTYLVNNSWNYLSSSTVGYILDGQMGASTDPQTVSVLQEFHNAFLISRVIKKITDVLNRNKHFLAKPDKIANLISLVNKELVEFQSKAATITYDAYYADDFDYNEGILTDSISIDMWITNKSHALVLNVARAVI